MNQKKQTVESKVKEIRRHTRKKYSAEEKIRIVIEGLRGEISIAELCRKEGINANLYYNWSKDFLETNDHIFVTGFCSSNSYHFNVQVSKFIIRYSLFSICCFQLRRIQCF